MLLSNTNSKFNFYIIDVIIDQHTWILLLSPYGEWPNTHTHTYEDTCTKNRKQTGKQQETKPKGKRAKRGGKKKRKQGVIKTGEEERKSGKTRKTEGGDLEGLRSVGIEEGRQV